MLGQAPERVAASASAAAQPEIDRKALRVVAGSVTHNPESGTGAPNELLEKHHGCENLTSHNLLSKLLSKFHEERKNRTHLKTHPHFSKWIQESEFAVQHTRCTSDPDSSLFGVRGGRAAHNSHRIQPHYAGASSRASGGVCESCRATRDRSQDTLCGDGIRDTKSRVRYWGE